MIEYAIIIALLTYQAYKATNIDNKLDKIINHPSKLNKKAVKKQNKTKKEINSNEVGNT